MNHLLRKETDNNRLSLLGNGELLFRMDREGAVVSEGLAGILPDGGIYRLGHLSPEGKPICYGRIYPRLPYRASSLSEGGSAVLDYAEGILLSTCRYGNNLSINTEACVMYTRPLLLIGKKFTSEIREEFSYCYELPEDKRFTIEAKENTLYITYADGERIERLAFFSSVPMRAEVRGRIGILSGRVSRGMTALFGLAYTDEDEKGGAMQRLLYERAMVMKQGEKLFSEQAASFASYFRQCRFFPDDASIAPIFDEAQYLLRCLISPSGALLSPTHEEVPFGHSPILNLAVLLSLLQAGHNEEAKKILSFQKSLLPDALRHAAAPGENLARYPYYTDAFGNERLPNDYRRESVLPTAAVIIGLSAYYRYTADKTFLLSDCFSVLLSSVQFLLKCAVIRTDGGAYVRASDVPEIGAYADRPYLSTVAVASALEAFYEIAWQLSKELDLANQCHKLSGQLLGSLPKKIGGGYMASSVADMGITDASLLSIPFGDPPDIELQRKSVLSARISQRGPANPYETALFAAACAKVGLEGAKPTKAMLSGGSSLLMGKGAESPALIPALCLSTFFRSVASYVGGKLYIGMGLDPQSVPNGSFRFPLPVGAVAEGRMKDGRLVSFKLQRFRGPYSGIVEVVVPAWLYSDGAAVAYKKSERDGMVYISMAVH